MAPRGPRSRASGGLLVVVVVVVVVAGVVVLWRQAYGRQSPAVQVASAIQDFSTLCAHRPIPGARPYVPGPGPHPTVAFTNGRDAEDDGTGRGDGYQSFEPYLFPAGSPMDPASVQLVACAETVEGREQVAQCFYPSGLGVPRGGVSVPMRRAVVKITVYEARTWDPVGDPVVVVADQSRECPREVEFREGDDPVAYTVVTEQQLARVVAPFAGG